MCCQLKTNRSSEQSGETGSGLFLTDSFLFGLVGSCGRGVCGSGGGCGGCGGSRRGRDSGACDGLLDVNSLERSDQCFDLSCVSLDSGGGEDSVDSVLGDVFAGRVEHHSAVDILHLIQLL